MKPHFIKVVVLSLLVATACSDSDNAPAEEPLTFTQHINPILQRNVCRACHYGGVHDGIGEPEPLFPYGFSLFPEVAYDNLVNRPSSQVPAKMRVKPGDPDNSYLVLKLLPESPHRLGNRMILSDSAVDSVVRWVRQGAVR